MDWNTPRGTRDLFGEELLYHNQVIKLAKDLADLYAYSEFHTPIFEYSDVFHRNLGETSDIVTKETYTFSDRDKRYITLRPEFTAAIARAIFTNKLQQTMPQRLFSYGPVFRHERPQKCRQRQFHQVNYEFIGTSSVGHDAEIIMLAKEFVDGLQLKGDYRIELNSLGCADSRSSYRNALVEYFSKYKNDLTEQSIMRLEKNPLRILDSKDEGEKKIISGAPEMVDYFTSESKERADALAQNLDDLGIEYILNPHLVRGLDYYTHTVFEFITEGLGAQGTILAGGRYDKLFNNFANIDVPAVGFAAGIERLAELMRAKQLFKIENVKCALLPLGDKAESLSQGFASTLRGFGLSTYVDYNGKLTKRMKKADQNQVEFTIVFGDNEIEAKTFRTKQLSTGEERELSIEEIETFIKQS